MYVNLVCIKNTSLLTTVVPAEHFTMTWTQMVDTICGSRVLPSVADRSYVRKTLTVSVEYQAGQKNTIIILDMFIF